MTKTHGVCVWLTGRSGSGKSTIADALIPLLERAGRTVTVLDVVPELAKLPGERTSEGKLMRKAFVAREVVRHGGVAVCVTVSARSEVRSAVRSSVGLDRFVEVHVDAPRLTSEQRRNRRSGRRSLAKRMRRIAARVSSASGGGQGWTATADLILDAVGRTPEQNAGIVLEHLVAKGFVSPNGDVHS